MNVRINVILVEVFHSQNVLRQVDALSHVVQESPNSYSQSNGSDNDIRHCGPRDIDSKVRVK